MSDPAAAGRELRARAHAKVNLRLRVFGREESGFHGLETVFLNVELADAVRVVRSGEGVRLRLELHEGVEPGSVPEGEENLCVRAARAYLREARAYLREAGEGKAGRGEPELPVGVEIRLEKRIPAGSGLGGGSADAAAVLRLMDRLCGGPLPEERLIRLAGELGSDVPFGLVPGSAALGWGRGQRLLPLPPPEPRPALVVLPGLGISTPEAYGWLDADRREAARGADAEAAGANAASGEAAVLPPPSELGRWEVLAGLAANDFEGPVFRRHPGLRDAREAAAPEATLALLSGSGDAVAAVYPGEGPRDRAARRVVEECGLPVRRTRTLSSPPEGDGPWPLV